MFTYIMKIYSYMNEQGGVFVGKEKIYKLTVKGDNVHIYNENIFIYE
nr:MAG TPA: hypothetical protein [Bacteriophage sp.]